MDLGGINMSGKFAAIFLSAVMLFTSGCAFMQKRGADAADMFSADIGFGLGIAAGFTLTKYVGYNIGAAHAEKYGLIGRKAGYWQEVIIGFPAVYPYLFSDAGYRGCIASCFVNIMGRDRYIGKPSHEAYELRYTLFALTEEKEGRYDSPFRMTPGLISVAVHPLFYGIRVGFDPIEFADFLAGWFTVDFMDDDEVIEEEEEDSEPEKKPASVPGETPKSEYDE